VDDFDVDTPTPVARPRVESAQKTPSWIELPRLVPQSRLLSDRDDAVRAAELAARHFPQADD